MTANLIDAHHHLWDLDVRDQPWLTGPDLAPLRRSFLAADFADAAGPAGVVSSVVVQTVTDPDETPELLATAEDSPLILGVVGWTDLTAPDAADRLARLRAGRGGDRLVGIRHQVQGEPDPDWLTRPDVLRGLAAVAAAGLVYDLVVTAGQLPAATRAAAAVPDLRFVLDHLGKPPIASGQLEPWACAVRDLAALPNTVCKLSGMVTEADWHHWTPAGLRPYADTVLDAFGPDRVMFGSDWPVCTLAASYDEVVATAGELTAALTEAERRSVFAGTAADVYGL
ncbi:L-fuconolactonase [Catenulispora sp. MAP12-49]|uniref:amidohydrolase family protein n=1 Tax=Catenulispora sp. MAP12-49 TaxID=3156302 RepID=UPI0035193CAE